METSKALVFQNKAAKDELKHVITLLITRSVFIEEKEAQIRWEIDIIVQYP